MPRFSVVDRLLRVRAFSVFVLAFTAVLQTPPSLYGSVPPPPNDTPASATVISTLPIVLEGDNINANDSISATTIAGLASVPGPDVFYSFTPSSTGVYWAFMIPWTQVPVYGSSGAGLPAPNLCIYIRRVSDGAFINGSDANGNGFPDTVVASLDAGETYEIVVDSTSTDVRIREFDFSLVVSSAPTAPADNCTNPGIISAASLPYVAVDTLTGAINDFTFTEGTGRCDVSNTGGLTNPGPDHVYEFTTGPNPSDAGEYVINLIPTGTPWNGYLYVADSCPPFLPLGCLGAASHASSTTRQAETLVVTLDFDKTYYIYVDAATTSLPDAKYALYIGRAPTYDIREIEPNDTAATATPLSIGQQNGGQIVGGNDKDYHSFAATAGSKLYAFVDNGNNLLSSIDSELRLFHTNGTSLIEFDDDDGEGSSATVNDLVQRSSSFSATISGANLAATGTYFLQVAAESATSTISRYRVHFGVEPGGRAPSPECEPNNSVGSADTSAKHFYSGAIATSGDLDTYAFSATAGDRIFIVLDGDPERESGGDANDDPLSLDGALKVFDADGDVLISDHDDVNTVTAGQLPDYPAEAVSFVAPETGTYHVQVSGGGVNDFGPGKTYQLAIFKADVAPTLSEAIDPVIDSITPDFDNDELLVIASDDAGGDSGICALALSADSTNLVINASFTPGDPTISFEIGLINPSLSGIGKLIVTDCAGNTDTAAIQIDATAPICNGVVTEPPRRVFRSLHAPIHAPDNTPAGINGTITIPESATITDVNVTLSVETIRPLDVDIFLESPLGTRLDIVTDRGGTTSGFDITDATFDNAGTEFMSLLSSDAPYTGVWLPEGPGGMAVFNGQNALGTWKLNVIDDSPPSSTEGGGCRLVRWSLDIEAGFAGPEIFNGSASDTTGVNGGIASIVLSSDTNVILDVSPDFAPGNLSATYQLRLINPSQNGSGTITVTDLSGNECDSVVSLVGLPDTTDPSNNGSVSRNIEFKDEVLQFVPSAVPAGVVASINVPDSRTVGEVEVDLTVDVLDVGRIAATLAHGGEFASLVNRVGMDERGSVGLTKPNFDITLDDDAPVADDAHEEPALGTIEFLGTHQPDGRGEVIGDGITSDYRDNMMFALEGLDSAGQWDLYIADFREQGAGAQTTAFRRWAAHLISPGAPERYVGFVRDDFPQGGICSIALAGGSINLSVSSTFTPGDHTADYIVTLVDPTQPGTGTVEITDCASNLTSVPVSLAAALDDQNLPVISGALNSGTQEYEGTATDSQAGDSGIASITLAPHSTNLQIVSINPNPPAGASSVDFVVGLINPAQNGRGYVRVTDVTGYRRHALVEIDATAPLCTGSVSKTKRYRSTDTPIALPDNNLAGVTSTISVPDLDLINDVDVTINISHIFDDDIDLNFSNPLFFNLFSDIGSTGNDFINTTLDDEAASPIPDAAASAPFTGRFQPQGGPSLFILDGNIAAGSYTLQVIDDAVFNTGTFEGWSITIGATTFPDRFAGQATDSELLGGGIASIQLLADACNVTLSTDPFTPGDKLVLYEVKLTSFAQCGRGTVRVSDMGGNFCDVPVELNGACGPGDLDHDGDVDLDDVDPFVQAILAGNANCVVDINLDGLANGLDIQGFTDELVP